MLGGLLGGNAMLGMAAPSETLGTHQQVTFEEHWLAKRINYDMLPDYMQESMRRWVEYGISGGGFMQAALANDFIQAACKADTVNSDPRMMKKYAHFMIHEAPPGSYGSWDAVRAWEARGGLRGLKAQRVERVTHEIMRMDDDPLSTR